jgi:hypothetical protein
MSNAAIYPPHIDPWTYKKRLPFGFEVSYSFGAWELAWRKTQPARGEWKRPDWRKRLMLPWYDVIIAQEYLRADGTWVTVRNDDPQRFEKRAENDPLAWVREVPITAHVHGEAQKAVMTVRVKRCVSVPAICRKRRRPRWIKYRGPSLDLELSREMGPRAGSWKGGTLGASTPVLAGESYEDAIRRYILSRRFDEPKPTLEGLTQ